MKTQRPLAEMVEDLALHISHHEEYMRFNKRILNVFEGQLRPEIEREMAAELSPQSFNRAKHRIPSFNLLSRITNKLSKVYMKPANRTSSSDSQALLNWEKWTRFDDKMRQANIMLNLHKITAVEPYLQEGQPRIRVIPAHQFLPYSDNPQDPMDMTVFIKFVKTSMQPLNDWTNEDGELIDPKELVEVGHYIAWSEDTIIKFQASFKGQISTHIESIHPNPLGVIPQTVITRSPYRLIPIPDSDSLSNTILIPKMYANLAYAVNLQAHGVLAAIDLDVESSELRKSPDVMWSFKTTDSAEAKQGRLEAVKVEVDIEETNNLVQNILSIWLETRNVKAGTSGKTSEQRASGAAKIIDQADASEDIETQKGIMVVGEKTIWDKIRLINNHELANFDPKLNAQAISDKFDVNISFPTVRTASSPIDDVSYIREQMSLGLMSRKQALIHLYPDYTEEQIDQRLKEAEEDQEFLEGITSGISGQFGSGNQEAAKAGNLSDQSKESVQQVNKTDSEQSTVR